jgi:hypothetical protein
MNTANRLPAGQFPDVVVNALREDYTQIDKYQSLGISAGTTLLDRILTVP